MISLSRSVFLAIFLVLPLLAACSSESSDGGESDGGEKDSGEAGADESEAHKAALATAAENLNAIRRAQKGYHAEWDAFTSAGATPADVPGKTSTDFTGEGYTAFQQLGWVPDGQVHCQYATESKMGGASSADDFMATVVCDLDGDGKTAQYNANRADEAVLVTSEGVY